MEELKPCPFCGEQVKVVICNDCGKIHNDKEGEIHYGLRDNLGYGISHNFYGDDFFCPIATRYNQILCDLIYGTEKEAAEAWNMRA